MIEIKLPFKTPSINHLYGHRNSQKYIKKEGVELRQRIRYIVLGLIASKELELLTYKYSPLKLYVEIHENWYTKKDEIARKDVSNREKFMSDSVFDALELNDKQIFDHHMIKVQDNTEFALIKIEVI